jgi:hypothetical protein
MDHFTSLTSRERDETQTRSLTRRRFLTKLTAGAVALGTVATGLTLSTAADAKLGDAPHPTEPPAPVMTGAEYVAYLGGAVAPKLGVQTENEYRIPNERWVKIAQGPLIEEIDCGALSICPKCLFVNYAGVPCQICPWWESMTPEDIADYVEDLSEESPATPEMVECEMVLYRMGRAVDLYDGPDMAWLYGRMLYTIDYLKSKAA